MKEYWPMYIWLVNIKNESSNIFTEMKASILHDIFTDNIDYSSKIMDFHKSNSKEEQMIYIEEIFQIIENNFSKIKNYL